jgi:hypothetical protein
MWMRFLKWFIKAAVCVLLIAANNAPCITGPVTIVAKTDHFITDHLKNLYAIHGQTITRYNASGILMAQFSWSGFDAIDDTDPSDPFKILIFNQSSASVMRLTNQLAPLAQAWSLPEMGVHSPSAVCNSWDNGVWVFDQSLHELIRINTAGSIDQRSGPINHLIPPGTTVAMIREHDFLVYMTAPDIGMLVWDKYANFLKALPLKGLKSFQVQRDQIRFCQNNLLMTYNMQTLQFSSLSLPGNSAADAQLQGNTLFVRHPDSVMIQNVIPPL